MQMIRWMCGVSMKDSKTSEKLKKLVGVPPITTVIRSHKTEMVWTCDEEKCRRPVGRPRRTWCVEADMAEIKIHREDVHDRKKWRKN